MGGLLAALLAGERSDRARAGLDWLADVGEAMIRLAGPKGG